MFTVNNSKKIKTTEWRQGGEGQWTDTGLMEGVKG